MENWKVSVIAMNGMAFDLSPYGRMLATFLSGIAEFERDLISERVKSGLAVAKARGKRLGRQAGVRPKSDRLLPKVVAMRAEGRSYRWIAHASSVSARIPSLTSCNDTELTLRVSFRPQPEPTPSL
nr:recombinase family protein [Klebsiella pneumoniae]